jgi:hypothetical protein
MLLVFFALPVLESGSVHLVTPLIRPHFFSRLRNPSAFSAAHGPHTQSGVVAVGPVGPFGAGPVLTGDGPSITPTGK